MKSLEFHVIQNFGPSCLNRDDTNSPKDCVFGGYRRARVSSQAWKKAIRDYVEARGLVPPATLSHRTKRLVRFCSDELKERGRDKEEAEKVVTAAINTMLPKKKDGKATVKDDGKTQHLVSLGREAAMDLVDICDRYWDVLIKEGSRTSKDTKEKKKDVTEDTGDIDEASKDTKKTKAKMTKEIEALLESDHAVDTALFGRMLAEVPKENTVAACQVAHAVSTNKIDIEYDYYVAMDSLAEDEEPGADMIGTVEFNSPCYYRYANLDLDQLMENLGGKEAKDQVELAVDAFTRAFVFSVPSGKQASFAAHNPPSLVLAVVRENGNSVNLVNAFIRPVSPDRSKNLAEKSVEDLCKYWDEVTKIYGEPAEAHLLLMGVDVESSLAEKKAEDFEALINSIKESL